jgi:hypothetical protein
MMKRRRVASVNSFLNYKPTTTKGGVYKISRDARVDESTGNRRTAGLIHPSGGIVTRKQHGMFTYKDDSDDVKWASHICIGKNCPICLLREFAGYMVSEDCDIGDESVLTCKDRRIAFSDLIGGKDVDFKLDLCRIRDQVVFLWMPVGREFDADRPVRVMIEGSAVLVGLQKMISEEISYNGDEGDLLYEPYVISFTYDPKSDVPAYKYLVSRPHGKITKITDDIQCILDMDIDDLDVKSPEEYCKPDSAEDIMLTLSKSWCCDDVSFDDYQAWYDDKCGGKRRKKSRNKKEKARENVVFCEKCEDGMVPNGDGLCPECESPLASDESDVPF